MGNDLIPHLDDLDNDPPMPHDLSKDEDTPDNKEVPQVNVGIVEDDTSKDEWRKPFFSYLLNKELVENPKSRTRILQKYWQFEPIVDSKGSPEVYKKTLEYSPLLR